MKSNVPIVEKLKSWPTLEKQLAREMEYAAAQQHMLERLKEYVESGRIGGFSQLTNRQQWASQPSRSAYLYLSLHIVGRLKVIEAYQTSAVESVQQTLGAAALYGETSSVLEFLLESEFPARFSRKRRGF